ncbi:nuclear transport factor 2-like protein [Spirosoma koreense]
MTDNELQAIFENYLHAFAAPSKAEQQRLLHGSAVDEVVYSNPGVAGSGINDLLMHIEGFQHKFPGGRFRINWLRQQHGQALTEWTQLDQDGSELLTAHSYVRVNEAGRITHWAGFWDTGAV